MSTFIAASRSLAEQHARAGLAGAVERRADRSTTDDLGEGNERPTAGQADSTLRWGGLAGVMGSLVMIVVFGIVAVFVGMDDMGPHEAVSRFADIRPARTVENGLYLVVLVLWVVHFLALHRALRAASPTAALFGSALSVLGTAVLAAGALPHIATAPISDSYHATGATSQDQATLVLLWQATQGLFDALLVTGLVILPMGVIALGAAMLRAPAFGKGIGGTTVALGLIGLAAATALLINVSPTGVAGVLALIVFHLVVGRKLHRLSRAPRSRMPAEA